jgi:hypothetical protein
MVGMREADTPERLAAFVRQELHRHPFRHGVEQRNRDRRALPGLRACDQRFQDRLIGVHARADIGDGNSRRAPALRPAGDGGKARLGLDQEIIGLACA